MNWDILKHCKKPIVLYGMGNGADRILDELNRRGITAAGVFASDDFVGKRVFRGFTVTNYRTAVEQFGDMVVLLAFGTGRPEVLENIYRIAGEQELYAPHFSVVPGVPEDEAFREAYGARLDAVYARLADEQSRLVFRNVLRYRKTGEISLLKECETAPEESYQAVLRLQPGDSLADLGAYRGDTAAEFIRYCPEYGAIYAFEPDPYTFVRLQRNTEGYANCTCYNLALSDRTGTVRFAKRGGRNSAVGKEGTDIPCDTLDHALAGKPVSFMNIDVEGQEVAALRGAEQTIRRFRPKILAAAYHRNEDLFTIPEQVLSYNPDYQLYMRHFPQLPAWDVNYYFV